MTSYLPYEPRQQQLLPSALQDWLAEEHLAYYISDVIDSLDLGAFHARYEGGGPRNRPFHPAMMVKVLVYGYATGVFSSREIARRQERLEVIRAARERLEERQRQVDTARGRTEGDERKPRDGDGNPKGGSYAGDFGVPAPKAQDNFTDPQSRIMKRAGGGFDYCYNAQTAVDDTAHLIVAAELTNNGSDAGRLAPMLEAVHQNVGDHPRQVLLGFRQFSMRGLVKAQAEWKLVCAALNLRKMAVLLSG